MLLNASKLGMSAQECTDRLFKIGKIATTPMLGWGEQAAHDIRFVFSNESKERLIGLGSTVKKALK